MKSVDTANSNKGFTLIEILVVVAIMVVMTGVVSLSLSLLLGSDAKQACQKIGSQLDEVKTGAMSRASEDLTIVCVLNPESYDWADKRGYYAVKQMSTLGEDRTGVGDPDKVGRPTTAALGAEHRYLCKSTVEMTLTYSDGGTYNISNEGGVTFTIDRGKGTYGLVKEGSTMSATGVVYGSDKAKPKSMTMKSGARSYTIEFLDTGKHVISMN